MDDAVSIVSHYRSLLGDPSPMTISLSAVTVNGPVRAKAGPGFVLVEPEELREPHDCATFRGSGGVDGRCGAWVLAHEIAHQWFAWTLRMGGPRDRVATEAGRLLGVRLVADELWLG